MKFLGHMIGLIVKIRIAKHELLMVSWNRDARKRMFRYLASNQKWNRPHEVNIHCYSIFETRHDRDWRLIVVLVDFLIFQISNRLQESLLYNRCSSPLIRESLQRCFIGSIELIRQSLQNSLESPTVAVADRCLQLSGVCSIPIGSNQTRREEGRWSLDPLVA